MKWNQLMVIVSLALHQTNSVQANLVSFSKINSLDPGAGEVVIIDEHLQPKTYEPFHSFSRSNDVKIKDGHQKMMKKMIKKVEMGEEDQIETSPFEKRQNNEGAIVPHKGGASAGGGKHGVSAGGGKGGVVGGTGKKGFGKGAKVAAGVGGAVALGGAITGAVHLAKNKNKNKNNNVKREWEEVQMIKRGRGGRRKRIAAQERAREGTSGANQKPGTATPKTGMSKGKAAMLVAGGAAAGAAVVHTVGKSGGGGGDPNAAAAPQ